MREVTLRDGTVAKIRLAHLRDLTNRTGEPTRGTRVKLTIGKRTFVALAVVHPKDNFCRATGRKVAANQLLKKCRTNDWLRLNLNTSERRRIFMAICPEYGDYKPKTVRVVNPVGFN